MITTSKNLLHKPSRRWLGITPLLALAAIPWTVTAKTVLPPRLPQIGQVAELIQQASPTSPAMPSATQAVKGAGQQEVTTVQASSPTTSTQSSAQTSAQSSTQTGNGGPVILQEVVPMSPTAPKAPATEIQAGGPTTPLPPTPPYRLSGTPVMRIAAKAKRLDKQTLKVLHRVVSIDLSHATLEQALTKLFKTAKVNFYIPDDLARERVTGSLAKVTFEKALDVILSHSRQGLTYSVDGGVFSIVRKEREWVRFVPSPQLRATLSSTPGAADAFMQGGPAVAMSSPTAPGDQTTRWLPPQNAKVKKQVLVPFTTTRVVESVTSSDGNVTRTKEVVVKNSSAARLHQEIAQIEFQNADAREAIKSLMKSAEVSYTIAPEVTGTVSASLKNTTLKEALRIILKQVNASYRIEGGVVIIFVQPSAGR